MLFSFMFLFLIGVSGMWVLLGFVSYVCFWTKVLFFEALLCCYLYITRILGFVFPLLLVGC
jgi:hypothetical protein